MTTASPRSAKVGERLRSLFHEETQPSQPPVARGVRANARLTATTGIVLVGLLAVQAFTLLSVRSMMTLHIVVGVLLLGPLALKLASTGYRMLRYYVGAAGYRRKGPPHPLMRALAPFLVSSTVVLLGSGVGLVVAGPDRDRWLRQAHVVSFWIWTALLGVHVVVYLWRVPGLIVADRVEPPRRAARVAGHPVLVPALVNGLAIVAAAVLADAMLPLTHAWTDWAHLRH